MKKFITYLLLTSLSLNVYFLYLKEKIDNHKKIQIFLNLFMNDSISGYKMVPNIKRVKSKEIVNLIKNQYCQYCEGYGEIEEYIGDDADGEEVYKIIPCPECQHISVNINKIKSPVKNIKITSNFGFRKHPISKVIDFHNGIDLSGNLGDSIIASDIGIVKSVYYDKIGGNQIIINYGNYISGYAHLNEVLVKSGDKVYNNLLIGKMGNTGRSTGVHLHYTLRDSNYEYLNPINYLNI